MRIDTLEATALVVFAASLIVIAAASIHFGQRIAAQDIPMQWGTDGRPTWYAPRVIGLWWMLYLAIAVGGGLLALAHVATGPGADRIWVVSMAVSVIMAGVQIWHLNAVTRWAAGQ